MVQRFRVSKYKSVLLTCLIPDPRDPVVADSYPYTSLKYSGVVEEPEWDQVRHNVVTAVRTESEVS